MARSTVRRVLFQCEGVRVRFSVNVSGYSGSIFHVLSVEVFLMNCQGYSYQYFMYLTRTSTGPCIQYVDFNDELSVESHV